jgi:hypothetical protein
LDWRLAEGVRRKTTMKPNSMSTLVRHAPWLMVLAMAAVQANELPEGSLLQRYGVQVDELPKPTSGAETHKGEAPARFTLADEQPPVSFTSAEPKALQSSGNPSIDAMRERDRRHCQNARQQVIERSRGKQSATFDNYIQCP